VEELVFISRVSRRAAGRGKQAYYIVIPKALEPMAEKLHGSEVEVIVKPRRQKTG
jgi:hypothetical protein